MDPIALEETVKTQRWALRVFQFLLAITEVNIKNALHKIYKQPEHSQQGFRKLFAKALLENDYVNDNSPRRSKRSKTCLSGHLLKSLPKNKTFDCSGNLSYTKTEYIQLKCSECGKRVRSYCQCNPGTMYCLNCYAHHISNVGFDE